LRNQIDEASLIAEKVIPSTKMFEDVHGPPPRPPKDPSQKAQWHGVPPTLPRLYYEDLACTKISRMTLIVFVLLSQVREEYRHDGASGLRLGWASYNGFCELKPPKK